MQVCIQVLPVLEVFTLTQRYNPTLNAILHYLHWLVLHDVGLHEAEIAWLYSKPSPSVYVVLDRIGRAFVTIEEGKTATGKVTEECLLGLVATMTEEMVDEYVSRQELINLIA